MQIVKINLVGVVAGHGIDYHFNAPPQPDTDFDYNSQYFPFNYQVAKNQELIVKYMLSDGSVHEEPVNVGTTALTYTITY